MKRKNIRLNDIQVEYRETSRHKDTGKLAASIKNMGLQEPLMVNPAQLTLISGRRRLEACKKAGLRTVRVAMPDDVQDACNELGSHVTDPDSMHGIPMTPREKLDLALRLGALPRPASALPGSFSYDALTAPAVGFTSRILWRLRATLLKAQLGDSDGPGINEAQHALNLMLIALERPIEGFTSNQIICRLHALLKDGAVPTQLEQIDFPSPTRRVSSSAKLPKQLNLTPQNKPTPKKPPTGDFRRGVDTISGAVSGLESLLFLRPPTEAEIDHMRNELRKSQKSIRHILKSI